MVDQAVVLRRSAVEKLWRANGGNDTWVFLRARGADAAVVSGAVEAVNDWMPESVFGEAVSEVPAGFAILLTHCADWTLTLQWLDALAGRLSSSGVSGSLGAAPRVKPRVWLNEMALPVATLFVGYSVDRASFDADDRPEAHWHVPEAATERIVVAADEWVRLPEAESQILANVFRMQISQQARASVANRAIRETGIAGMRDLDDARELARNASLVSPRFVILQDVGPAWVETVYRLRRMIVDTAVDMDWAQVRPASVMASDIDSMAQWVGFPGVSVSAPFYHSQLLDRWVPDAAGLQVLRGAHLRRAHDLSGWLVTELGDDRYLVEAADLAPWYADPLPDPEVLNRARADFGDMILTQAVVDAHAQLPAD